MEADSIMSIAKEIKMSTRSDKMTYFSPKYPEFVEKYPMLFQMCCEDKHDFAQLEYMIGMLKNIQQNKMTETIASANVGQKLYDVYVKQHVDESKELMK